MNFGTIWKLTLWYSLNGVFSIENSFVYKFLTFFLEMMYTENAVMSILNLLE